MLMSDTIGGSHRMRMKARSFTKDDRSHQYSLPIHRPEDDRAFRQRFETQPVCYPDQSAMITRNHA